MSREKIFVSAYACEPGLGSEIGVGWHWVLEMSRRFDLWVLTRESNRHTIEPWIASHPEYAGIHFLYFDLPKWARFWKKGLRGVRTYYNIWTALTDRIVKRTMRREDIRVFHHITYGNALWPVSDYGSRQTFIWGPIGGLETIPEDYSRHYDRKSRLIESVRRMAVRRAAGSRSLCKRAGRASLILCKTEDTLRLLPAGARENAVLFTDVAAENSVGPSLGTPEVKRVGTGINCVVVGRLDAWRGFDIAIMALAEARRSGNDFTLTIVGDGMDRPRLAAIVDSLGVGEQVRFAGKVSGEEYRRLMEEADIVLNPSLKEGAVTVSFDAMAMGKPLVALDTGGYTRYFKPEYSVVIPRGKREETVRRFAGAMVNLADADKRRRMGEEALKASGSFNWEQHGREICETIEKGIAESREKGIAESR
ncbi:MAG: glycosyltransferase family 4 protein [Muribaculaceae bacterium]|nr:glycosyltransferase family 4 protein [Muribaculaceae bacterium]